jgi:hypothetical protein
MTNRGDLYQERTKGKDVRFANILAAKVRSFTSVSALFDLDLQGL